MEFSNWREKFEYIKDMVEYDEDGCSVYSCPDCGEQYDNAYEAANCCKDITW